MLMAKWAKNSELLKYKWRAEGLEIKKAIVVLGL